MKLSEEAIVSMQKEDKVSDKITASYKIPYGLINSEVESSYNEVMTELRKINEYYKVYYEGAKFFAEGTNGDYVPTILRSKQAYTLINKEARFLFAQSPDLMVKAKGDLDKLSQETKDNITRTNNLIETILEKNMFEDKLLKGAKDCFIGKRVALLVNFNEEDGVTLSFLNSMQFLFEVNPNNESEVVKFVCFTEINKKMTLKDKRYFKKKYILEDGKVYLEESIYDGGGMLIEEVTKRTKILLKEIPVCIFINDGLTGDLDGDSDVRQIIESEATYSKLSSSDIDAQRKSMNPTKYAIDMDSRSTKNLSSSPGSFWDLGSDQNLDNPKTQVGILEPAMSYSEPLRKTMARVKLGAYELLDVPDISQETLQGMITSGKALKAIYWPLTVRCSEKMKMWGPQLQKMLRLIVEGSLLYPNCIKKYTKDELVPVDYKPVVTQNLALPEDEIEEKNMDLAEVDSKVMSRKAYMQKWRQLTDLEVEAELQQIALERQMIEDSFAMPEAEQPTEELVEDDSDNYADDMLNDFDLGGILN